MIPRSLTADLREKILKNGYDALGVEFFERVLMDYPWLKLRVGRKFAFRSPKTIVVGPVEPCSRLLFLHEVSHAVCGHRNFRMDVERLKMEVEAWEKARELARIYGVEVNEELVQAELDTYRDWLHQKSRCPQCGLTRFQTPDSQYHCPLCENL